MFSMFLSVIPGMYNGFTVLYISKLCECLRFLIDLQDRIFELPLYFSMQDLVKRYTWGIAILEGFLTLFTVVHFALATFMDPGKLPKGYTS